MPNVFRPCPSVVRRVPARCHTRTNALNHIQRNANKKPVAHEGSTVKNRPIGKNGSNNKLLVNCSELRAARFLQPIRTMSAMTPDCGVNRNSVNPARTPIARTPTIVVVSDEGGGAFTYVMCNRQRLSTKQSMPSAVCPCTIYGVTATMYAAIAK